VAEKPTKIANLSDIRNVLFMLKNISIMVSGWKMRTLPGSVDIMEQDGRIGSGNGCVKMLLPGVRIPTGAVTVMVVT